MAFVGDSLTERGDWAAMFPAVTSRNYGVDGDTTIRLRRRVDLIIEAQPAKIFLQIGTNDIGAHRSSPSDVVPRYARILRRIRAGVPNAQVFVELVLPREAEYATRIEALNRALQMLARDNGALYVDLFSAFATRDGALRPEFTTDGLHLNAAGYDRWQGLIATQVTS
ncbi:MAG: GDSL-type esterase/lipase family protein [Terricaulis sp.]